MKKVLKVFVILMIAVMALCAFSACSGEDGKVNLYVVSADGTSKLYTVDTTGKDIETLKDFLDYIVENEEFTYTEVGGMVISINGIEPDSTKQEFWGLYTDLKIGDLPYFDNAWGTATVNNVEYGSATKGITELPLSGGATYIFKVSTW